jgi:hypothetical protein
VESGLGICCAHAAGKKTQKAMLNIAIFRRKRAFIFIQKGTTQLMLISSVKPLPKE